MHDEGVAQVDVAGPAGGLGGAPTQHRRLQPGGDIIAGHAVLPGRGEDRRDEQMRSGDQPGGGVVGADVGEQEQGQQAAVPGPHVRPPAVAAPVAAFDVVAHLAGVVLGREAHRHGAAHPGPGHPPARADEFVVGGVQLGGGARHGERLAVGAVDPDERRCPGGTVIGVDAALGQHVPDHLPAGPGGVLAERAAHHDVAVTHEGFRVHLADYAFPAGPGHNGFSARS
jgi:hypothetical protein